jgi:N-acetylmuramoyl-L-alanine amidase
MPAVRIDLGYLTSAGDRARLIDPQFRERAVEAMMAAVQRMYFPVEVDVKTGTFDVRKLRALTAAADRPA